MIAVTKYDLLNSFNFISSGVSWEANAWISLDTGKIYWVTGDSLMDGLEEELPDDFETSDRYIALPNANDLDLGGSQLVFRFIREQLPQHYDRVAEIFSRKGAFGRYKNFLASIDALDKWHAYEEEVQEQALREWCADHDIEIIDDHPPDP